VPAVLAAVLIVALCGYTWYVRSSPTTALMAFLRAQDAGDVKTTYELLSLRSRMVMEPEAVARTSQRAPPRPTYVVREVKRKDGSAEVVLDVIVEVPDEAAPGRHTCSIYMVHEAGRWRVDMVHIGEAGLGDDAVLSDLDWLRMWRGGPRGR